MSLNDLREQLAKQLLFIKNSADWYDRGDLVEAVRLATAMRVLMHDTANSVSLLTMMQRKSIDLVSSMPARDISRSYFLTSQLSSVSAEIRSQEDGSLTVEPKIVPRWAENGERNARPVSVTDWWNEAVYFIADTPYTRRQIVLAASNKDGGAHVDTLPTMYASLKSGDQMRTRVSGPDANGGIMLEIQFWMLPPGQQASPELGQPVKNAAYSDLRQMAYELLASPELAALAL